MEKWKDIPGWVGLYQVSNLGSVRSLDRVVFCKGKYSKKAEPRKFKGRLLTRTVCQLGYEIYVLCKPGKKYCCLGHQLVLLAFVGPRPKGHESCHNNGVRNDNRLVNLRYGTNKENQQDSFRHGTRFRQGAFESKRCKLTPEQVRRIRENKEKLTQRQWGKLFGVQHSTIGSVHRFESYWRPKNKKASHPAFLNRF